MAAPVVRRIDALSSEDLERATATLSDAFATDPLNDYTFQRQAGLRRAWFAHRVRYGLAGAELYAVGDCDGVAIFEPAVADSTARDTAKAAFRAGVVADVGEEEGKAALGRFDALLVPYLAAEHAAAERLGLVFDRDVDSLMILGVDPAKQRRGIGSALDRRVMLLTFTEYDVAFYTRLGFATISTWQHSTLRCTLMMWTPI